MGVEVKNLTDNAAKAILELQRSCQRQKRRPVLQSPPSSARRREGETAGEDLVLIDSVSNKGTGNQLPRRGDGSDHA